MGVGEVGVGRRRDGRRGRGGEGMGGEGRMRKKIRSLRERTGKERAQGKWEE